MKGEVEGDDLPKLAQLSPCLSTRVGRGGREGKIQSRKRKKEGSRKRRVGGEGEREKERVKSTNSVD